MPLIPSCLLWRRATYLLALLGALFVVACADGGSADSDGFPETRDLHSLAFVDGGDRLLFGHHDGLFSSDDQGQSWDNLVDRENFDAMALQPAGAETLYLAGHFGLHVSTDGGTTWDGVRYLLPSSDIHALAVDPRDPQHLYAFVVANGIFQSNDGGTLWMLVRAQPPGDPMALAVSSSGTLFASLVSGGVVKSDDEGQSWQSTGLPDGLVFSLAVDPNDPTHIVAGINGGVAESFDAGETWQTEELDADFVAAVAFGPDGVQVAVGYSDGSGALFQRAEREAWKRV